MRPGMYGAYHHISVPEKKGKALCCNIVERCVKIMIGLPTSYFKVVRHFIIQDTVHSHSMGFQYNGKLRAPEVLYTIMILN